jgi:hypothetical protein
VKYFALGWCTTSALVDCSGHSWCSSLIGTPVRGAAAVGGCRRPWSAARPLARAWFGESEIAHYDGRRFGRGEIELVTVQTPTQIDRREARIARGLPGLSAQRARSRRPVDTHKGPARSRASPV